MYTFYSILFSLLVPFLALSQKTNSTFLESHGVAFSDSSTLFILVRHAEKDKGENPGLTPKGIQRSHKLDSLLNYLSLDRIYSSDFIRTKETVKPLAATLNKNVEIYNAKDLKPFADTLMHFRNSKILISGHSNSTPSLANLLCECSDFNKINESDYSNIFVVVKTGSQTETYFLNY